jgi:hypothetical protein
MYKTDFFNFSFLLRYEHYLIIYAFLKKSVLYIIFYDEFESFLLTVTKPESQYAPELWFRGCLAGPTSYDDGSKFMTTVQSSITNTCYPESDHVGNSPRTHIDRSRPSSTFVQQLEA